LAALQIAQLPAIHLLAPVCIAVRRRRLIARRGLLRAALIDPRHRPVHYEMLAAEWIGWVGEERLAS
jgi:hypothetical protein